jgi:hypothetical protein
LYAGWGYPEWWFEEPEDIDLMLIRGAEATETDEFIGE